MFPHFRVVPQFLQESLVSMPESLEGRVWVNEKFVFQRKVDDFGQVELRRDGRGPDLPTCPVAQSDLNHLEVVPHHTETHKVHRPVQAMVKQTLEFMDGPKLGQIYKNCLGWWANKIKPGAPEVEGPMMNQGRPHGVTDRQALLANEVEDSFGTRSASHGPVPRETVLEGQLETFEVPARHQSFKTLLWPSDRFLGHSQNVPKALEFAVVDALLKSEPLGLGSVHHPLEQGDIVGNHDVQDRQRPELHRKKSLLRPNIPVTTTTTNHVLLNPRD